MFFIIFYFYFFSIDLSPLIIEDTAIEEHSETINKKDTQSDAESLEKETEFFLRKSGGIGSNIFFYTDSSSASQISLSIEGFDYTTPSLADFTPSALYFGGFGKMEINKDNGFDSENIVNHSANINFLINDKNYISYLISSFSTFGISANNNITTNSFKMNFGGILLTSENNFNYTDFNNRKRTRKNSFYKGGDFYIKLSNENFKFLNYFLINRKGSPGSAEFERTQASSYNLQNLTGITYKKEINEFESEIKISHNYKNYLYEDKAPPIFGLKEIRYNLISQTFSGAFKIGGFFFDFWDTRIKLGNLTYLAESKEYNNQKNIPKINEYHNFISSKNEFYFLNDDLSFNISTKYYFDNLFQYSLSIIYYIKSDLMLKIINKKGIRIPYLEEKYWKSSSVTGNKDLTPEIIYKNMFLVIYKKKFITFKTELYYSILKNNIIFMPISFGLVKAVNTKEAESKGLNIKLDLNFKYLKLKEILTYTNAKYIKTRKYLPQTPKLQNKLTINLIYKKYSLTTSCIYTDKYYNNIFNTDIVPQKHLLSLDLKYYFNKNLSNIDFKIENLTDATDYYDYLHIPLPPRAYYLYFNLYF